eukprot:CAMPEP_0177628546 /NCGR_PEP_ID=MMETSP0447-20121125/189_1 /TAXON_ID=0 /ORGANISM="Stygamoeba regulata, Strain BSH-02190019" /LENGTH=62 /DNA_ID=CAMNT_0019129801 /DNA_START=29 /DNA_END=217 /DNA_ORIENTATION=+
MAKGKAIAIKMVSMAGTGFFYRTQKNPRNIPQKLMLLKYDPMVQQHVLFKEEKISRRKVKRK